MSCGVGHRRGLDPELLWRRSAAMAPNRPLGWEPPYASGAALKKQKDRKKKERDRCKMQQGDPIVAQQAKNLTSCP